MVSYDTSNFSYSPNRINIFFTEYPFARVSEKDDKLFYAGNKYVSNAHQSRVFKMNNKEMHVKKNTQFKQG